ncbi:MAG: hypothetical protein ACXVJD_11310 [Mucilaginibacter sp.]
MKIEPATRQRIVRNAFLSLFIYVLPIALMFITFSITGQRPWKNKAHKNQPAKSVNTKNATNNGNSD